MKICKNHKIVSKWTDFLKSWWEILPLISTFLLLSGFFLNLNSLSADSIFSRKYIVWVISKITKNLTAGGWQWSLARVVWGRPRVELYQNESYNPPHHQHFDHPRIHLAPSILGYLEDREKWRSRNQNRSSKLKMLILSQMPIPQTVLSILSYLSISIAIYWKLTNSLNTLHSSQFNRVHLAKNRLRRFRFNNHFIMMNFWGKFRSIIGNIMLLATGGKWNDFGIVDIT